MGLEAVLPGPQNALYVMLCYVLVLIFVTVWPISTLCVADGACCGRYGLWPIMIMISSFPRLCHLYYKDNLWSLVQLVCSMVASAFPV